MNRLAGKWILALLLFVLGISCLFYWGMSRSPAMSEAEGSYLLNEVVSGKVPAVVPHASVPFRKLVVLNSNALEAVHILGAENRIVGVYSDITVDAKLWSDLVNKPHVGKWSEPNVEAIARLSPDAVIHYSSAAPHLEAKLEPLGIKVMRLDFFKIDSLPQEMLQLGKALDKLPEAQRFNNWHHALVETIQKQTSAISPKARVYLENYSDYRTVGLGSGMQQLCEAANGLNVAAQLDTAYPSVAPEWVVHQNPEMILKLSGKVEGYALQDRHIYDQIRDQLMRRPAWEHIKAIQNGRVHVLHGALTSGPRMAVALAYIAKWVYPTHVHGLDPDAWHKQYMTTFLRKPYQGYYASSGTSQ